ncbi:MAG TPA: ABC transporter permease [Mycobacteriales bacterium]|jgi:ABC-2 type transport system permease protein|nr:ABC transporter permease [Mycobacteriales bacterium]
MTVVAEARATAQSRLRWELLVNLVRKDLKVKYQASALGFVWSLATPLLLLTVYYLVFSVIIPNGVPNFAVYLMAGLLPWNAFASAVAFGCGSVVGNANLVKKVRFPTTVLPLVSVGYAAVHFVLQMGVFAVFLLLFHRKAFGPQLVLLLPAMAVLLLFSIGLAMLVGSLTVRYRDVQHLVDVLLLAWFWLNPVIYGMHLVHARLAPHNLYWVYFLNPMAGVTATFQRALYVTSDITANGQRVQLLAYRGYAGYLLVLGIGAAVSLVTFAAGLTVFRRMRGDFAEDL